MRETVEGKDGKDGGKRWREMMEGNNVRETVEGNDVGKLREIM